MTRRRNLTLEDAWDDGGTVMCMDCGTTTEVALYQPLPECPCWEDEGDAGKDGEAAEIHGRRVVEKAQGQEDPDESL